MDIIKIFIDQNNQIQITGNILSGIIVLIILILWQIYFKFIRKKLTKSFEIDEVSLGIGNANVKLQVNEKDIEIAYKMWVELGTRKIGLEIDFISDVIVEVYNSWYECFKIIRELIKEIPVSKAKKNKSTRSLIDLSVDVLNIGLRPHLTKWQAKFRKWYQHELEKTNNSERSPQEIQNGFKDIQELKKEMRKVNTQLINYTQKLKEISIGCREQAGRIKPVC